MEKIIPDEIARCLPEAICECIEGLCRSRLIGADEINEIRLRALGRASLTCNGENFVLDITLDDDELSACVTRLCHDSVYAHGETIKRGYIIAGAGIRVGICGRLSANGCALERVTSLNIRVPHVIRGVSDGARKLCCDGASVRSALFYSPPGVGKTTLLRDLAASLGRTRRVAVIDTRGEICVPETFSGTLCDALVGYGRAEGIEIATRTLAPELIVCDEIGDADEARQIVSAANVGVPIIASAHAASVGELMARPSIRMLHDAHVFSHYIGISRERERGRMSRSFILDHTLWEEIN